MSESGQNNYKGINSQSWAAMSLFLQYLKQPSFSHIQLEGKKFEDFTLFFNDGHKVICEAKDRKRAFSYENLKALIDSILKKTSIGENDEILVICTNLSDELKNYVEWMKYIEDPTHSTWQLFRKKKFSEEAIIQLKKVRFWKVSPTKHYVAVYSLFGEVLNFWLPEDELECKADSILLKKIYQGSAKGDVLSRTQLMDWIDDIRNKAKKYSGYFKDEKEKAEQKIEKLLAAIRDNADPVWSEYPLSALSTESSLMWFVLEEFKKKEKIDLQKWASLWELNKIYHFSFQVFDIFQKNLHLSSNRKYVLETIKNNISEFRGYFRGDIFELDVIKTLEAILTKDDKKLYPLIFEVIKKIMKAHSSDYFYLKGKQHVDYRKEQICKILVQLYDKADNKLQNEIYKYIFDTFNLVADDGGFDFYTPSIVLKVIRKHLVSKKNLGNTIKRLTSDFVDQYDKHYEPFKKKSLKKKFYQGWELMGGGISSSNGNCTIGDRHFVESILQPLISEYYKRDKDKAWEFISKECVAREEEVSRDKPDFLNRAVIHTILNVYFKESSKKSDESFETLSEFATSKRGIPHKADLIFQEFRRWSNEEDKKCRLVKVVIDKWQLPINPFIDDIVLQLLQSSKSAIKSWARKTIESWFENPKYFERDSLARKEISHTLNRLIESEESRELGIEFFKTFIRTSYFKEKYDQFNVYDLGRVLNGLLKFDFEKGIEILNELKNQKNLTWNQQTLLTHGFLNSHDKESDTKEFLISMYDYFVDGWLTEMGNDNRKVVQKLTESYPRQRIVEFAEALAKEKEIEKALRIIECFIDDPDPCLPEDEKDEESKKYNEHKKIMEGQGTPVITSVRGYCTWTMQHCLVMEGGKPEILFKILEFTKKMASKDDKNYYIKHMVCYPLARLAQLRLAHIGDKETLFFSDNLEEVLQIAKDIENIAFDLLEQLTKYPKVVQKELIKSILSVFNYIRGLNTEDTKKVAELLLQFPEEALGEAAALFIYFAYYREGAFKDWKWQTKGLYDDLSDFDSDYFKEKLNEILSKKNPVLRSKFAWQFFLLTDHRNHPEKKDFERDFKIAYKNLQKLMKNYDKDTFGTIFRFVKDNINTKFEDCFKLFMGWLDAIPEEKGINDLGYQQYDELLEDVKKLGGDDKFLNALNKLLDKSKNTLWGRLDGTVQSLQSFPKDNSEVGLLFDKLIEMSSKYYDAKQDWLSK